MIKIEYDGKWPNLCRGNLTAVIDGKKWVFPKYCLMSGGSVSFDNDWREHVTSGPWSIEEDQWPEGFPVELKIATLEAINQELPHGCCGGCV